MKSSFFMVGLSRWAYMESEHYICSEMKEKQARINGATVSRRRVSQVQEEHVENAN